MRSDQLRAILQSVFLLVLMPALYFLGVGCLCGPPPPSGSDSGGAPESLVQTQEQLAGPGEVNRNHYVQSAILQASAGEASTINQALPGSFLGILLPTAPGATQPGQVTDGANFMGPVSTPVALKPDRTQATVLEALFPAPAGSHWVAMVISDTHALDSFFNGPINMSDLSLYLSYGIDFQGTDPCNGCEVKLVGCVPGKFAAFLPSGVIAVHSNVALAGQDMACTQPVSTYITLVGFPDFTPLPGAPAVAAFGLFGSLPTTATIDGLLELPVNLEHTAATTRTFDLAPIQSALGWTYDWADLQGTPITQVIIPAPYQPPFIKPTMPDMKVTASGLPACTQIVDVLTLQATDTISSELHAETQAYVQVLPDPAKCTLVDVAAHHEQSTAAIIGGDRITYTLTISNLTSATVSGIITQTLAPATAVRGAELPAGCTRSGATVTCQVPDVPAQGAASVQVVILGTPGYSGTLSSIERVNPAGAADTAYLDNAHGPLVANVSFSAPTGLPLQDEPALDQHLFIPLLKR